MKDELLAESLLFGDLQFDNRGLYRRVFLSKQTIPTEEQARKALCRVLLLGVKNKDCLPNSLLIALADVFDTDGEGPLKVTFKKRSKGHSDLFRDESIAFYVHRLRTGGKSYQEAVSSVADAINKNEKHIERIYSKHRKYLARRYPLPASDRRSRAVM